MRLPAVLTALLLMIGCASKVTYQVGDTGPRLGAAETERRTIGFGLPVRTADDTPLRLKVISTPMPPYPRDLIQAGISGPVSVRLTVQPDGSVSDATIVGDAPPPLAAVVRTTMLRWKFVPASVDGGAGPTTGMVQVIFSIEE